MIAKFWGYLKQNPYKIIFFIVLTVNVGASLWEFAHFKDLSSTQYFAADPAVYLPQQAEPFYKEQNYFWVDRTWPSQTPPYYSIFFSMFYGIFIPIERLSPHLFIVIWV